MRSTHRRQFSGQIPSHIVGPNQRQMRFLAFGGVSVPRHICDVFRQWAGTETRPYNRVAVLFGLKCVKPEINP